VGGVTTGGGGGVGGVTATIANAILLVPGSNPQNLDNFFVIKFS
jgi:hypothetical protein